MAAMRQRAELRPCRGKEIHSPHGVPLQEYLVIRKKKMEMESLYEKKQHFVSKKRSQNVHLFPPFVSVFSFFLPS